MLSIYVNPQGRTIVHQSGFSVLAALALPLWAFHRGHPWGSVALAVLCPCVHAIALAIVVNSRFQGAEFVPWAVWILVWSLVAGILANRYHARMLDWRGYARSAIELR